MPQLIGTVPDYHFHEDERTVHVAPEDFDRTSGPPHLNRGHFGGYVHVDATSAEGNEAMIEFAVREFGAIDVLVTAAGVLHGSQRSGDLTHDQRVLVGGLVSRAGRPRAELLELTIDDWRRTLEINLTGTMLAVRAAAGWMVEAQRGGSVITLASIMAKFPSPPYPYAVSKAGVWMFTKVSARELAPLGIRVNAIGPGYVDTNMTAAFLGVDPIKESLLSQVPMGRFGVPNDIAAAALFLASDDSSYVTGEILHVDGGFYTE